MYVYVWDAICEQSIHMKKEYSVKLKRILRSSTFSELATDTEFAAG